jgi:tetratricopeptide (TPR) repeat protein
MIKMITLFLFVLSTGAFASDYSDGMDAMRERKYERAIERFTGSLDKDVIKGLVSAAKVKEQLNKAKTSYFNEMNTKISGYDKEKKYNDALDNVERGLRVLPENAKFASMKADYEKRIKDLDAKVKEGELLMNSKNWQEAYVYFQKLRPYEDTNRDINSNYRRAKEEIIDSYTAQAEGYEKNYDFISAKKEYEKALAYEPKDEGLNKKINVVKGRIVAQEMLGSAKTLSDQGQKEKSFEMLKAAHAKDDRNKEIVIQMDVLRDEVAQMWLDRAQDLETKEKYQDAYILINKAEELRPKSGDIRKVIDTAKKSMILNFAKYLGDKAAKFKTEEESYIYYIASYALNSSDKNIQQSISSIEQSLKDKTCYNLGFRTTASLKVKLSKDTLDAIDNAIKNGIASFVKDKCINVTEVSKADQGEMETKGSMLMAKLDIESQAMDLVTKRKLVGTRKMELFAGEAAKNTDFKVEKDLVDKVTSELVSEIKDSNLRYYGDRYYWLFNGAKDPKGKTTNAVLTFISRRYLSDEDLYADTAVKYILKTYSVDIDRKEIQVTDKIRL